MSKITTFSIPIRIVSESNVQEHWRKKWARKKKQTLAIKFMLKSHKPILPCKVTITRIAPRMLDEEDNLPSALKTAKDAVADHLVPNLAAGRADGDKRIQWAFKQEKGRVREYYLRITIEET